jgi:O-glycosyl hydrolase
MDLFFSPTVGIGYNYVRTASTFDGSIPDLVTLQAAVARGVKVWMSFQSPPATLKQSGSFNDGSSAGGAGSTCFTSSQPLATSFASYATYMVNYINTLATNGVPLSILDVQNEPDVDTSSGGSCVWTGAALDTFVGTYLGPALATAGLTPRVMLPSTGNWIETTMADPCLNDLTCAQYVNIVSGRGYGYPFTPTAYPLGLSGGRHLWMGETSSAMNPYDPSIANALVMANNIHQFMVVANVSSYGWWELAYQATGPGYYGATAPSGITTTLTPPTASTVTDSNGTVWGFGAAYMGGPNYYILRNGLEWPASSPGNSGAWDKIVLAGGAIYMQYSPDTTDWYNEVETGNFGLTDAYFNPAKRFYAMGNWSKFVRPGWVMIGTTANPASGVYVTAFRSASTNSFAIVAINNNSSSVDMTFSLSGFPSISSVTPTVTSAADNLADQPTVPASSSSFSYPLPAQSVVTFH